ELPKRLDPGAGQVALQAKASPKGSSLLEFHPATVGSIESSGLILDDQAGSGLVDGGSAPEGNGAEGKASLAFHLEPGGARGDDCGFRGAVRTDAAGRGKRSISLQKQPVVSRTATRCLPVQEHPPGGPIGPLIEDADLQGDWIALTVPQRQACG